MTAAVTDVKPDGPSAPEGATRYGAMIEERGLSTTHQQTIDWVPRGARVLELGCSTGYIGRILAEKKGCDVVGVEVDPEAAEEARRGGLNVRVGSLEDEAFLRSIEEGRYDMVLANDVLEHVRNPDQVMSYAVRWLAPGGHMVISTPNIASWGVRSKLFFHGSFRYEETGIMDRTHVHFFTWETFHELLERHGVDVVERAYENVELPLATNLLVHWPDKLHHWIHGRAPSAGAVEKASLRMLSRANDVVIRFRQRTGLRVAKRRPNVCLPHIVVLVAPAGATGR